MLAEYVMLAAPRGNGRFVIVTDASNLGIGCALMQEQEGELILLEFGSKKFTEAERNWDVREKEAYGIKWSCEHFQDYIKGFPTLIVTDHESLRWMHTASAGKVQRWALFLQQFDLEIRSLPGLENLLANWMSRSFPESSAEAEVIDTIAIPVYNINVNPYAMSEG